MRVALRKESVDRNIRPAPLIRFFPGSLSVRRAWIEIVLSFLGGLGGAVALRKESVDRNTMRRDFKALDLLSLSVRRAWIEI